MVDCHRGVPKLTSPIEAVTVSIYVMPVTSSQHTLWDISMVMVGPTKRLADVSSHGNFDGYLWGLISYQRLGSVWKPGSGILFSETGLPGGIFTFSVKILGALTLLASCFIAGMMRGLVHPRKEVVGKQT